MGQVKHHLGLCLDARSTRLAGTPVQMLACNSDVAEQQWTFNSDTGQIQNIGGARGMANDSR